jgi:N-carbamoyl-L-amino-acid hydrolase
MSSGAGHDAQMFAGICPTGMIFTPSVGGISHNVTEFTEPADIEAGANVLLHTLLELVHADLEPVVVGVPDAAGRRVLR